LISPFFWGRYSPHGRWTTEENIQWDRLRVPPIASSPHALHISDSLDNLRPGDHIEIQWRRNKDFPYGMSHPCDLIWLISKLSPLYAVILLSVRTNIICILHNLVGIKF